MRLRVAQSEKQERESGICDLQFSFELKSFDLQQKGKKWAGWQRRCIGP